MIVDSRSFAATVACVMLTLMTGCDSEPQADLRNGDSPATVSPPPKPSDASKRRPASARDRRSGQAKAEKRIQSRSAREDSTPSHDWSLTSREAADLAVTIVRDSAEFAPALVVWLVDVSPSAMLWGSDVHAAIRDFYAQRPAEQSGSDDARLLTAVVAFGQKVDFILEPTGDQAAVLEALDSLRLDDSGREATFEAIQQALDKYLSVRTRDRREVVFVVVSDEAGDDWQRVDDMLETPRKYALPVYVIGAPAPFGRLAALDDSVEGADVESADGAGQGGDRPLILQGPESRRSERIRLAFGGFSSDFELMDSGFGPFGLERLCRTSGGTFLAVRGYGSRAGLRRMQWPTAGTLRFEPDVMRRYLPDQLDQSGYDALLQQNAACRALHLAAQLEAVEVLVDPQLFFVKRDEADMKKQLDKAQQAAAKVAPGVDRMYEILREGAGARSEIKGARWQAGFDLAFGRICAAKARIDGYNAMLAGLKRGKKFAKANSKSWVLEPAEMSEASSSLRNLSERARTHLQRVVEEHPGTPWAAIAEYELKTPPGWRWTESE